eukprot:s230_g22.t1
MAIPTEFQGTMSFTGAFADEQHLPSVREAEASRQEDRHLKLGTVGIDCFDEQIRRKVREEKAKLAFFDALVRREVQKVQLQLAQDPTLCNVQLRHFGLKSPLHFMSERTRTASEWEDISGRSAIFEDLFRARADPTLRDASGRTPLHTICMWDGDVKLAKRLVECRADPSAQAWRGAVAKQTPLELLEGRVGISPQLFDRGYQSRSTRKTQELQEARHCPVRRFVEHAQQEHEMAVEQHALGLICSERRELWSRLRQLRSRSEPRVSKEILCQVLSEVCGELDWPRILARCAPELGEEVAYGRTT